MDSAGGRAADADGERAETYLRLLAEAALRSAADGDTGRCVAPPTSWWTRARSPTRWPREIMADLQLALRLRGRSEALSCGPAPEDGPRSSRASGSSCRPGAGPRPAWRGRGGSCRPGPATPGSRLMALILTGDKALAPATLCFSLSDGPPEAGTPLFTQLTATDDPALATGSASPDGTWAGSAWTGTVIFFPSAARRCPLARDHEPERTVAPRANHRRTAPPPRRRSRARDRSLRPWANGCSPGAPRPCSPRTRSAILSRAASPVRPRRLAALEGAGVLAPLSPAPARLSALGQLLGLAMQGPADEVPGAMEGRHDTTTGAASGSTPSPGPRRSPPILPEIDGARFAIAGLRSGSAGTFLHVLVDRLPRPVPPQPPGHRLFLVGQGRRGRLASRRRRGRRPRRRRRAMLRLALLPPLRHEASALTAEIRGATQQLTANLPVRW